MNDSELDTLVAHSLHGEKDLCGETQRDASFEPIALHLVGERHRGFGEGAFVRREGLGAENHPNLAVVPVARPVGDELNELADGGVAGDQQGVSRRLQVVPDNAAHLRTCPVEREPLLRRPLERVESLEHLARRVD